MVLSLHSNQNINRDGTSSNFAIVFLVCFLMSVVGMYKRGYDEGRKQMLNELINKGVISSDIYVKFLKLLQK